MDYIIKNIIATLIIIILAIIGFLFTPKSRSSFGYKSPRSMQSDETWNYANNLAKRLFIAVAILFIILEVAFYSFLESDLASYKYSFLSLTILSILIIPIVEIMLHLKFFKNEKPKK
ncbi:SdpI family protein [Subsaxibacter sp. CAU 1640]|uniref:SdpI family protein n=1 Tax=Subsaxibacter sp. CAU 1640 TaxID=2933271 RepID=UPI0020041D77|nr:SdpI family protein [Subsaxibacter sp. CAU 1640]MCK7591592.1 SdpI family protein [Subsaxibacter sp. CAU 1640]